MELLFILAVIHGLVAMGLKKRREHCERNAKKEGE